MLKRLQNDMLLWVQAKTGLSTGLLISLAVAGGAILLMFVFLCVTGYAWLSLACRFGGLAMAGVLVDGRHRRSCIRPCAPSDPPAGYRGAGGAGSRDKGSNRSQSAGHRDAGGSRRLAGSASFRWPCSVFWLRNGCGKPGAKIHPIGLFKRPSPCRRLRLQVADRARRHRSLLEVPHR